MNDCILVAEVKTRSPFGFTSPYSWEEQFAFAEKVGDIISIHTDSRWSGSFELLEKARTLTKKPLLAKGIHAKDDLVKRAVECGAEHVLVVGRIPRVYLTQCWIEPLTFRELVNIPEEQRVVWNSRDLQTGALKQEYFEDVRKYRKGWLCQASTIKSYADVHPGAQAVLVGTFLREFIASASTYF